MNPALSHADPIRTGLGGYGISGAVAACLCAGFVWSAQEAPLPALPWAAAFLFLAVEHDVRSLRIPNWLTFGGLAVALGLAAVQGGAAGLLDAGVGAGVALAVLFVPFAMRWLGAGDVKAMMVLGALWGREPLLPTLFWIVLAGGALAIAMVAARGEIADLAQRWWRSFWITCSTRKINYFGPAPGSVAGGGLPFAVAIGIGAAAYQLLGTPWQ